MPSPYRRGELIADTATLVYLLSVENGWLLSVPGVVSNLNYG
jgi:hypothetical protein